MKAVVQRVNSACVTVNDSVIAEIGFGLVVLLGVDSRDNKNDSLLLAKKIVNLRIFSDSNGRMNRSLIDVSGEVMLVSQFTLHAKTRKGNRPSFNNAACSEKALLLYNNFKDNLSSLLKCSVKSGQFGALMKVSLINDGPVTIIIDTKD